MISVVLYEIISTFQNSKQYQDTFSVPCSQTGLGYHFYGSCHHNMDWIA